MKRNANGRSDYPYIIQVLFILGLLLLTTIVSSAPVTNQVSIYTDPMTGLPHTPHYDQNALTWDQCQELVANHQCHALIRSDPETARYRAWGAHVSKTYVSMEAYILHSVFTIPTNQVMQPNVVLKVNDFPYNIQPDIQHWCLWSKKALSTTQITVLVNHWLKETMLTHNVFSPYYPDEALLTFSPTDTDSTLIPEWIHWVNPVERQSLPGIWHAHILVHRPVSS